MSDKREPKIRGEYTKVPHNRPDGKPCPECATVRSPFDRLRLLVKGKR